jgi:hypothetical protein
VAVPIFTYLAVAGSVLIALLFVVDATREKGTPALVALDFFATLNLPIGSTKIMPNTGPHCNGTEVAAV